VAKDEDQQGGRSGGGGEEPEERTDGWMTTYADMVTLLMTFFVLMFAISNVDQQKALLFFAGMTKDGLSQVEFERIIERLGTEALDDPEGDKIPEPPPPSGQTNPALRQLYERISGYIDSEGLGDHVAVVFNGEFLLLTLASDIVFDSASAYVKPEMRLLGVKLAEMLYDLHDEDKPFEIVVAGHTDNMPINTPRYPSNWHVSVDRAVNFLEILIEESGLQAAYFYARGCGEERPIDTNDTSEGRQANRRVEVMISLLRDDVRWGAIHPSLYSE